MIVDISCFAPPCRSPPPPFLTSPAPSLVISRVTQSVACLFFDFFFFFLAVCPRWWSWDAHRNITMNTSYISFFLLKRTAHPKMQKICLPLICSAVYPSRLFWCCEFQSFRNIGRRDIRLALPGYHSGKMARTQMQMQVDRTTKTEIQVQTPAAPISCATTQKDEVVGCNQTCFWWLRGLTAVHTGTRGDFLQTSREFHELWWASHPLADPSFTSR